MEFQLVDVGSAAIPEMPAGAAVMEPDLAERIASRDHNNLYLTSRLFADPERYSAFCAKYAVMRVIDDQIDSIPLHNGRPDSDAVRECERTLQAWRRSFLLLQGHDIRGAMDAVGSVAGPDAAELAASLGRAIATFPAPAMLWHRFFRCMERDIHTRRFATRGEFDDYCEGASGSPTTIYLYLLSSRRGADSVYRVPPGFPLEAAGRCLGHFAYLAHILRDLGPDTTNHLVYLAEDDMANHGLNVCDLETAAAARRSPPQLRALVRHLSRRARASLLQARMLLDPHWLFSVDCRAILRLIVRIYEAVLEKIQACDFEVLDGRHMLTQWEKMALVNQALAEEPL